MIEKFAIAEDCHVPWILHLATKHMSSLSVSGYFSGGGVLGAPFASGTNFRCHKSLFWGAVWQVKRRQPHKTATPKVHGALVLFQAVH